MVFDQKITLSFLEFVLKKIQAFNKSLCKLSSFGVMEKTEKKTDGVKDLILFLKSCLDKSRMYVNVKR